MLLLRKLVAEAFEVILTKVPLGVLGILGKQRYDWFDDFPSLLEQLFFVGLEGAPDNP